jgi:hypothetical protein
MPQMAKVIDSLRKVFSMVPWRGRAWGGREV